MNIETNKHHSKPNQTATRDWNSTGRNKDGLIATPVVTNTQSIQQSINQQHLYYVNNSGLSEVPTHSDVMFYIVLYVLYIYVLYSEPLWTNKPSKPQTNKPACWRSEVRQATWESLQVHTSQILFSLNWGVMLFASSLSWACGCMLSHRKNHAHAKIIWPESPRLQVPGIYF